MGWRRPSTAPCSDAFEAQLGADITLTTAYQGSDPIATMGFTSIDFSVYVDGTTLATLYVEPQWSSSQNPTSDTDWNDYLREEFETASSPTGNGLGVESTYATSTDVAALPGRVGISIPSPRGSFQRVLVKADNTVTDVTASMYYTRRAG